MAYIFTNPLVVGKPSGITSSSSTPVVPVGTERNAVDSVLGEGIFKYLKGCSVAAGVMVTWKTSLSGVTSCAATANTANQGRGVAVAMAVVPTNQYGWYQIVGNAVIKKTAVKISPASKVFQSATAGRVFGTATSGKQIVNAIATPSATVASATSTVVVQINRPFLQGQAI